MLRRLSLRMKLLAGFTAVVVLAGGFVAYQIANQGDPEFRRGGGFGAVGASPALDSTTTTAGLAATPDTTTAPSPTSGPQTAATPGTTATTASPTTITTRRGAAATSPTTAGPPAPAPVSSPGQAGTAAPTPPSGAAPAPTGFRLPALGEYAYTVDGEEKATLVGTRRLPNRMVTVVHGAPDLAPDQVVFDLRYSDDHEEREIVGFRGDGVYFDFEGGSVTFGPRTETSEADYDPPMLQIPGPLEPGATRSGKSTAKRADGTTVRTEEWKVKVLGQERVTVAGAAVDTWKVQADRKFTGESESGTRTRTYWFDPARNIWVKFTEVFHGERRTAGFTGTFDTNITATLESFKPA